MSRCARTCARTDALALIHLLGSTQSPSHTVTHAHTHMHVCLKKTDDGTFCVWGVFYPAGRVAQNHQCPPPLLRLEEDQKRPQEVDREQGVELFRRRGRIGGHLGGWSALVRPHSCALRCSSPRRPLCQENSDNERDLRKIHSCDKTKKKSFFQKFSPFD